MLVLKKVKFNIITRYFFNFFICYMAAPKPTLAHCCGGSLTHLILVKVLCHWSLSFFIGRPKVTGSYEMVFSPYVQPIA